MARIGQILVERGWLTDHQLQTALRNQRILGGRLGTCLLEIGAVSEEALLGVLTQQTRLPAVEVDELRLVEPRVLSLLPPRLALRYRAVPFRAFGAQVDLVMLGFDNIQHQDELAFGLGKNVRLHIAPEVRILEALQRHYGAQCPNRIHQVLERLNRALLLGSSGLSSEAARELLSWEVDETAFAAGRSRRVGSGAQPARGEREQGLLVPPRLRLVVPAAGAPAPPEVPADVPAAPRGPVSGEMPAVSEGSTDPVPGRRPWKEAIAEAERHLAGAGDAETVGRILVEVLGRRFERAAIFRVRRRRVEGWLGSGATVDADGLRSYLADLGETSAFSDLDRGAGIFRGHLSSVPAHDDLMAAWDDPTGSPCVLVPVRVAGRLVLVLYADRGRAGIRGDDVPPLFVLAARAASALQRCLGRRRSEAGPR